MGKQCQALLWGAPKSLKMMTAAMKLKDTYWGTLSTPFWCLCQKLSLSPLYFNKTLLHKSSEWSSLISGPRLNSSPPGAKNPGVMIQQQPFITFPTKVHLVKAMVFPVVMYGCESWTVKKDEHWRIDAFELWCWRRLLSVPWTARRSNQSILKEISPGCSLEGLMLKLKLQSFGHLMQRADSFKKTLMLGKIEGGRRRGRQRMRWLGGITDSMDMSLNKLR